MSDRWIDNAQLVKDEDKIVELIKEWLWNNEQVTNHIKEKVKFYWADSYGINLSGPQTDFQEEFVCQCQVQIMMGLLAKVMV